MDLLCIAYHVVIELCELLKSSFYNNNNIFISYSGYMYMQ